MRAVLFTTALALAGCHDPVTYDVMTGPRDWAAHPAIVQLDPPGAVYAASDVHGGYDRFLALLVQNGLVDAQAHWTGGNATLVVTGDLFDKGPQGLDVIDLLRALQTDALASGGMVVVTLGNHEAEFFADPINSKAEGSDGVDKQLAAVGIEPVALASGVDPRGLWLRQQPFGARIGDSFFAHAGDTHGRTLPALDAALRVAFDTNDFRDPEFTGAHSLLESRDWYGDKSTFDAALQALGVHRIVFGHDPNALGPRGTIAVAHGGALFRIDCGMSPDVDDSHGALLRIRGGSVDQLAADGTVTAL